MCPAGNNREGAARRESILTAFHDIDSFAVKCCPGTWLYLNGLRAAFAHMNAPADPYPIGDSAEAATALPASPRAA